MLEERRDALVDDLTRYLTDALPDTKVRVENDKDNGCVVVRARRKGLVDGTAKVAGVDLHINLIAIEMGPQTVHVRLAESLDRELSRAFKGAK